jgi:hypothetical protein
MAAACGGEFRVDHAVIRGGVRPVASEEVVSLELTEARFRTVLE